MSDLLVENGLRAWGRGLGGGSILRLVILLRLAGLCPLESVITDCSAQSQLTLRFQCDFGDFLQLCSFGNFDKQITCIKFALISKYESSILKARVLFRPLLTIKLACVHTLLSRSNARGGLHD